jgi:hypothetical protein
MGPVSIRCDVTGRAVKTDIDPHPEALARTWADTVNVRCPYCGGEHTVIVRDAYVASEIAQLSLVSQV